MNHPSSKQNSPRVAIVCDWLLGIGGAERVVLELHRLYPGAPIYTSQYDPAKIDWFKDADVRTGWLQHVPGSLKKFLPVLRAIYFRWLNVRDYDVVISSSGAEAKAVRARRHIWYCHAPTHYYWSRYESYLQHPGFGRLDWLARLGLRTLVGPMQRWDFSVAQKPDVILANSTHTAADIKRFYKRDSTVVFPPVDTARFVAARAKKRHGFVITGRQTPYKRIDLAVAACSKRELPLTVVGFGPDHAKLQAMAGPSVRFVTNATDAEVTAYVQGAEAFIFPGVDDFGIAAVEALAAGTPVIAYKAGGALDYVTPETGLLFGEQTSASLEAALLAFRPSNFDHQLISRSAERFSTDEFRRNIQQQIRHYVER